MSGQNNNLKEIADRRGIKYTALAEKVGISVQSLAGFMKKRHGVSDEVLIRLAIVLDVLPEDICPDKTIEGTKEGKKYLLKAIKMTDQYYSDQNFDENLIIDIATELYNILVMANRKDGRKERMQMKKDLKRNFNRGLASKCFLDSLKTK